MMMLQSLHPFSCAQRLRMQCSYMTENDFALFSLYLSSLVNAALNSCLYQCSFTYEGTVVVVTPLASVMVIGVGAVGIVLPVPQASSVPQLCHHNSCSLPGSSCRGARWFWCIGLHSSLHHSHKYIPRHRCQSLMLYGGLAGSCAKVPASLCSPLSFLRLFVFTHLAA